MYQTTDDLDDPRRFEARQALSHAGERMGFPKPRQLDLLARFGKRWTVNLSLRDRRKPTQGGIRFEEFLAQRVGEPVTTWRPRCFVRCRRVRTDRGESVEGKKGCQWAVRGKAVLNTMRGAQLQ